MIFSRLVFRVHAIQRMFQRGIGEEDVRQALSTGETIEEYPDDTPYPSRLILGRHGSRPLHVVVADNTDTQENIVITVYEPDPSEWEQDFKRRKKP
ncbi:MAG: DUF4258 domain-containing protein [Candidatus Binatia bacterium]